MSLSIKIISADRAQARPGDVSPPSRRPLAVSGKVRMMSLIFSSLSRSDGEVAAKRTEGDDAGVSARVSVWLCPPPSRCLTASIHLPMLRTGRRLSA